MELNRADHIDFLETELRNQTALFQQKLETNARYLLERHEVFVSQFVKLSDGKVILRFSKNRGVPRRGSYFYAILLSDELADYRKWGSRNWGDLVRAKVNFTELTCVWQSASREDSFYLAGFAGVDTEFIPSLVKDCIVVLGPQKPPFEYLVNLQRMVERLPTDHVANRFLEMEAEKNAAVPSLFPVVRDRTKFLIDQLHLSPHLILQGPPGTGKTYLIAELCAVLLREKKSVLVTALTNKALIELAAKPMLEPYLKEGKVYKANMRADEFSLLPTLKSAKNLGPNPGTLLLSTFFLFSDLIQFPKKVFSFDYIIVDEASQGFLSTLAAAAVAGQKCLFVGDTEQLPPVAVTSEDLIRKRRWQGLLEGLRTVLESNQLPYHQLATSYRLPPRAACFTSLFYALSISSGSEKAVRLSFPESDDWISGILHQEGGPCLLTTDLPVGERSPLNGISLVARTVRSLLGINEPLEIAVLTFFVETVATLQRHLASEVGLKRRLLIDTVSRIQGMTCDVCIYFIPGTGYHRSLEPHLFNVATSRARRHTIIIADRNILSVSYIDNKVREFLEGLIENQ